MRNIASKARMRFPVGGLDREGYSILLTFYSKQYGLSVKDFTEKFNTMTCDLPSGTYVLIEFTFYDDGSYSFEKGNNSKPKESLTLQYVDDTETIMWEKIVPNITAFMEKLNKGFMEGTLCAATITFCNGSELSMELGLAACTIDIADKSEKNVFGYRTGKRKKQIVDLNVNCYPDNMLCTSVEILNDIVTTFIQSGERSPLYKWSRITI